MKTICKDTSKDIHCPLLRLDWEEQIYYCIREFEVVTERTLLNIDLSERFENLSINTNCELKCTSDNCTVNKIDIYFEASKDPVFQSSQMIETFTPEKEQ